MLAIELYPLTKRAILSAKLSMPLPSAWERRKMFSFLEGNDEPNLSRMDVHSLMDLRKRVDEVLIERRAEIQKQLDRMDRR
jgi:hypothetical protein